MGIPFSYMGEGEEIVADVIWLVALFVISAQDIRKKRIEDKWIFVLLLCDVWKGVAAEWVLGAVASGLVFFLILFFAPGSFGGGDVKLSVVVGYYLGAEKWFYSFAIAVFSAGMVIVGKTVLGKIKKKEEIAFGPYLCLGAAAVKVFM